MLSKAKPCSQLSLVFFSRTTFCFLELMSFPLLKFQCTSLIQLHTLHQLSKWPLKRIRCSINFILLKKFLSEPFNLLLYEPDLSSGTYSYYSVIAFHYHPGEITSLPVLYFLFSESSFFLLFGLFFLSPEDKRTE